MPGLPDEGGRREQQCDRRAEREPGAAQHRSRSAPQHADPEEAYRAFLDLGARTMVPMHWGCFDLTDEPVDLAPKVLAKVLERTGADRGRVRTMAVGERWRILDD